MFFMAVPELGNLRYESPKPIQVPQLLFRSTELEFSARQANHTHCIAIIAHCGWTACCSGCWRYWSWWACC